MSQKEILGILKSLGGRATSAEIRQKAKQDFPDRELFGYASMRLHSLENRHLVSKEESDDGIIWQITKEGKQKPLETHTIEDSCDELDKEILSNEGVEIVNIVSVIYNNTNFNLPQLYQNLPNSVYQPETDGYLTFYPSGQESVTIRVPSSGTINISGASSKKEIISGLNFFESKISELGYTLEITKDDIEVENIVAVSDIQAEIDLPKLASSMSRNVEYDIDNSNMLIFRPKIEGTMLIYRTGKVVATGLKTYRQIISLFRQMDEELPTIKNANIAFS